MKPTKLHTDYCRNLIVAGKPHVPFCMPDECPLCVAYKAGREDAAEAVEYAIEHESYCWTDKSDECQCQYAVAVAAARGVELTGKASLSDLDADEIRIKDGEQS